MLTTLGQPHVQVLIAVLSALISACYLVCMSNEMKSGVERSSLLTLGFSHVLAIPFVAYFLYRSRVSVFAVSRNEIVLLGLTAALLILARMLYFYAYARTQVASVTVFSALTPIYAIATSFFFFGESVRFFQQVGLFIICFGLYAYFLPPSASKLNFLFWVSPFRYVLSSRPILFAFLSTIPTAFAAPIQKSLIVGNLNVLVFSFWLLAIIGTSVLVIALFVPCLRGSPRFVVPVFGRSYYFASIVLLPLMHVLFSWVIQYQPTAVALVLQRSGIAFQILFAYFFLKERQEILKRALCVGMIFVGFWLVVQH